MNEVKRICYICGKEIKHTQNYYVLNFFSYSYDVETNERGYKELKESKFVHYTCFEKAKIYFRAIKEGEL